MGVRAPLPLLIADLRAKIFFREILSFFHVFHPQIPCLLCRLPGSSSPPHSPWNLTQKKWNFKFIMLVYCLVSNGARIVVKPVKEGETSLAHAHSIIPLPAASASQSHMPALPPPPTRSKNRSPPSWGWRRSYRTSLSPTC